MFRFTKFAQVVFAAIALTVASCSDKEDDPIVDDPNVENPNDDNPNDDDSNADDPNEKDPNVAGSNIKELFPLGLPSSVNGYSFTQNDKGQVTKMSGNGDEATIEYGSFSRANKYDVVIKYRDKEDPEAEHNYNAYLLLNDNGFATEAVVDFINYEDDSFEMKIEYNSDNQPKRFVQTGTNGKYELKLTYSDGSVKIEGYYNDGPLAHEQEFLYTNSTYKQPVANKGGVQFLLFEGLDEAAYYAGLLGKSPFKNLPMAARWHDYEEKYESTDEYVWKFNADQLPLMWGIPDEEDGEDELLSEWNW